MPAFNVMVELRQPLHAPKNFILTMPDIDRFGIPAIPKQKWAQHCMHTNKQHTCIIYTANKIIIT